MIFNLPSYHVPSLVNAAYCSNRRYKLSLFDLEKVNTLKYHGKKIKKYYVKVFWKNSV